MKADTLLRSAAWLLIYWIKCRTSKFVIVLKTGSNYASEYTQDHVLQVSDWRLFLAVVYSYHAAASLCKTSVREYVFFVFFQISKNMTFYVFFEMTYQKVVKSHQQKFGPQYVTKECSFAQ